MTNKEILEKAITKAIDGGFEESKITETELGATGLIFRKDFAKALWGEELIDTGVPDGATWEEENIHELAWKYHLQQMVIADDPIKYLGENI